MARNRLRILIMKMPNTPKKFDISGLEIMCRETQLLETRVSSVCDSVSRKAYGALPSGISVYLYGSPGRREMVGGDGDADVFILERRKTAEGNGFRELFIEKMERFDYSKLDLPEWGILPETEIFLEKSLVEGNQVFETRFVWGDKEVDRDLVHLKQKYNSVERAIKNFIFNRLYLDEYSRKKTRNGAINVKYCNGGSRELLFLSWYDDIVNLSIGKGANPLQGPRCFEGARTLVEREKLSQEEYKAFVCAVDYLTVFRTNILGSNRLTRDRGLSFLDCSTLARLVEQGYSEVDAINKFEKARKTIRDTVERAYDDVLSFGGNVHGSSWERSMRRLQSHCVSERDFDHCESDPVIIMGKLWRANNMGLRDCFLKLVKNHRTTQDWAVIGTIVNSNFCPSNVLDQYGRGICREKGFGYLLRVIARNPNTSNETLRAIAEDQNLEQRYTSIARAALSGGVESTKNQL